MPRQLSELPLPFFCSVAPSQALAIVRATPSLDMAACSDSKAWQSSPPAP
ncbi:hypothetical protein [Amycolatopsis methanolica]|nr:hypothetical protein [Amycolatopsis methanolica]